MPKMQGNMLNLETHFTDEISYLPGQLSDCLHRTLLKPDETNFIFSTDNVDSFLKMSNISINIPPRELNPSEHNNLSNNSLTVIVDK